MACRRLWEYKKSRSVIAPKTSGGSTLGRSHNRCPQTTALIVVFLSAPFVSRMSRQRTLSAVTGLVQLQTSCGGFRSEQPPIHHDGRLCQECCLFASSAPMASTETTVTPTGCCSSATAMIKWTAQGADDKGRCVEEPCEAKVSRTVLKQRWGPRGPRRL